MKQNQIGLKFSGFDNENVCTFEPFMFFLTFHVLLHKITPKNYRLFQN